IKLILLKNSEVLNLNNYTIVVAAKKIDGKDIFNYVKTIDAESGICEVEITEQMLALNIDLPCEIVLYGSDGTVAGSSNFVISRIPSLRNEESIISSSEFTALTKALTDVTYVKTELDNKANKNEIFTMSNMGQDIKENMTGGSVAVVGRYSVGEANIIDNGLTIDKLPIEFKKETGNLVKMINYEQFEETEVSLSNNNLQLLWAGGKNTYLKVLPFTLNAGEIYYLHLDNKFSNNQIQLDLRSDKTDSEKITAYINSNQNILQLNISKTKIVNYIYIYGVDINFNGHIWIDKIKDNHTYYEKYKSKIVLEEDLNEVISKLYNISKDNLSYELLEILYDSGKYNFYNYRTSTEDKMIDCLGNITNNTGFILTDYIDVQDFLINNSYIWFKQSLDGINVSNGNAGYVAAYNIDKVNICTNTKQFYDIGYIASNDFPSETKYIRVCFPKSYSNFGIGIANSCLYDFYTKKHLISNNDIELIENSIIEINKKVEKINETLSNISKIQINKKCLFYGDSITNLDLFQKKIKEKLGITYINDGNPGYPISNVFSSNSNHGFALTNDYKMNGLISTINTQSIQYVFIMGGTNDFGYDGTKVAGEEGEFNAIQIGDLSYPYNKNTFKGALSNIVDRLLRECPNVEKIFIMSPIQRGSDDGSTDIIKNALGLSMYDFRDACKDVANKFSCEFIDVFNCGINFINWSKYIPDKVHPNEEGAKLIANKAIEHLKNIIHK
ncbi:MAG: SGNH/GDSL hydrolase family protein, partial [Romboutsia sp.]